MSESTTTATSKDGTCVRDIVAQWLRANHYDGLCNPKAECGCSLESFMPCVNGGCSELFCVCAYSVPCGDEYGDGCMSVSNGEQDAPSDTLEQVALDMYRAMAPLHDPCCEETCCNLADDGWPEGFCLCEFRDRLKALGVSVDA